MISPNKEIVWMLQVACHYEDVWTKLPKMMFAASQEERETLVGNTNQICHHCIARDKKENLHNYIPR